MPSRLLLALAYLVSGAAGLLYQVTWLRQFTLAFGHTHAAVSAVLAAFLGGLAIGAALVDRPAATATTPTALRRYAWLEAGVGLYALVLPMLLHWASLLLATTYGAVGGLRFGTVRTILTLALVAVPAAALGATFPLAVRAGRGLRPALGAGALYALNTLGAAAGAAVTGFVWLPRLGVRPTLLIGVGMNALAAAVALVVARRETRKAKETPSTVPPTHASRPATSVSARAVPRQLPTDRIDLGFAWVLCAAVVSGLVTIALEVVWTRILTLVLGPTTWAFALMLALFISGLALGAAVGAWLSPRVSNHLAWMGASLGAVAAATFLTPRAVEPLVLGVASAAAAPGASLAAVMRGQALVVAAVLLPKALLLGATFPLALGWLSAQASGDRTRGAPSARVGILYAVNTAGAIAGSLGAGWLALPHLGLHGTIVLTAIVAALASCLLLFIALRRGPALVACLVVAVVAAAASGLSSNPDVRLLSSGAYKYAAYMGQTDLRAGLSAGDLLYYRDGGNATVAVRRMGGITSLSIDGKVDASDGGDMLTQRLLAHVPLLLHGAARDVAVIGLGSGVTPGAALLHADVRRLDVLEISPEVVAGSHYFAHVNGRPLDDARTRLIVGDARAHVLFTSERYDVMISEPSNPWMAGMAALFTREFFEAVRARLAPGGLMCQWAHTYDMGRAEFGSIVATFQAVFPHVLVLTVGDGDVLLLGASAPLTDRVKALAGPWPASVAADLASVGVSRPFALLSLVAGDEALATRLAAGAPIERDSRLALEFAAPRFIFGRTGENLSETIAREATRLGRPAAVEAAARAASATDWRALSTTLFRAAAYEGASRAAQVALELDPSSLETVDRLLGAAAPAQRVEEARLALAAAATASPSAVAPRIGLSRFWAATGDFEAGVRAAQEALALDPASAEAWEQLASVLADAGDAGTLSTVVEEMDGRFPSRPATWHFRGTAAFLRGDARGAIDAASRGVTLGGNEARTWNLLGAAYASLEDLEAARRAFEEARRRDGRDLTALLNLARLEESVGNLPRARDLYFEALAVDPHATDAVRGLASVADKQGDTARAAALRALAGP